MNIRKFIAPTTRQALRDIRSELGDEAVILSNRKVKEGVEIIAMANEAITKLTSSVAEQKTEPSEITANEWARLTEEADSLPFVKKAGSATKASSPAFQGKLEDRAESPLRRPKPMQPVQSVPPQIREASPRKAVPPVERSQPAEASVRPPLLDAGNILGEIKSMHNMLQQQLAALSWGDAQQRDPQRASLLRRMLNSGFSALLARQLMDKLPAGKAQAESWIKEVLKRNLRVAAAADDIVAKGGVYALIGPTGVGKTTTTAKLAARAVVRYGADKVALLTTDSYRIGAYEQLKIYGKILGVAVHAVKDTDDLRLTLSALKHKHLVLIDTVGMGQRDARVGDQNEMFDATGVQRLLLLNATSSGDTLDDVARMYHSNKVIGCIATKLDEAASLGAVLDVAVRHRLVMHYIANGQRVPEDMHPANSDYLLHRALKPAQEKGPFALQELEFPALMTGVSTGEVAYAL